MASPQSYPLAPYDYGRYPPDRGAPTYGYSPAAGGYPPAYGRAGFSTYGNPTVDDRNFLIILDRVSISESNSDADKFVGTSPECFGAPTLVSSTPQAEEPAQDDVSDEVADQAATGKEAAPEEETVEEEAAEQDAEPSVPCPITHDIYVRLVQDVRRQ